MINKNILANKIFPLLSSNFELLKFFLEPTFNERTDRSYHFFISKLSPFWFQLYLILYECRYPESKSALILKQLIVTLFLYLYRENENRLIQSKDKIFEIIHYIETNANNITIQEAADRFGYNPNYLSQLLIKKTNKSFSKIVLDTKMHYASLLLARTSNSVENIASMVGYSSLPAFYKAFRSYYNETPSAHKKRLRQS